MADLILPVRQYTGTSSWAQHQRRTPRSSEPGTDFYVPHGTPVYAPADGRIYGAGWDIKQPAGRWVGVDFVNGMGFRCMHHADLVRTSGLVEAGELIAYSGASGYGSEFFGEPSRNAAFWRNTGGDHTHVTLWPTHLKQFGYDRNGRPFTIDFMQHVDASNLAGGNAKPFEEDEMSAEAEAQIKRIHDALFNGNAITGYENPGWDGLLAAVKDSQNKLSIPGVGYGRPEVIQRAVGDVVSRLETGAGYDWLPAIANQGNAILAALGSLEVNGAVVDVAALADALREGLGAEVADELAKRLTS